MEHSLLAPPYWQAIADPAVKTVLMVGTGGGFDFVHGLALYPELMRLGKRVVIGSYSFGNPRNITGGTVVFEDRPGASHDHEAALAKLVDGKCIPDRNYGPEVGVCQFLDEKYPAAAPHSCYAYYARAFTVTTLTALYRQLVQENEVDLIIAIDGGSDSLMRGDEAGLGDPIEDATTVAALRNLQVEPATRLKPGILLAIGVGCDRFNEVSDAATLRAIAELNSTEGGYLGTSALLRGSPLMTFYDEAITFLQERARFRSVIANSIVETAKGAFGSDVVPPTLRGRVRPGELFLWPLMAMYFAFSVEHVAARCLTCAAIADAPTVTQAYVKFNAMRHELEQAGGIRNVELLPTPSTA